MCPTLAHCETMKCRSESRRELVMANVLLPAAFYCQNVASRFYSSGFSDSQLEKNNVASTAVQHNRVFLRKICKKSLFVMFLGFPARKWGSSSSWNCRQTVSCVKKRSCRDIFSANRILEKIFIVCSLQFGMICVHRVLKNDILWKTLFGLKGT